MLAVSVAGNALPNCFEAAHLVVYPEDIAAYWKAWHRVDVKIARTRYRPLARFIHVTFGGPDYVQVIKTALCHCGVIDSDEVRLPLLPLDSLRREVLEALE